MKLCHCIHVDEITKETITNCTQLVDIFRSIENITGEQSDLLKSLEEVYECGQELTTAHEEWTQEKQKASKQNVLLKAIQKWNGRPLPKDGAARQFNAAFRMNLAEPFEGFKIVASEKRSKVFVDYEQQCKRFETDLHPNSLKNTNL